ncbi:MAG: hypothetical protein AB8B59_12345 [Maribacter sp.]
MRLQYHCSDCRRTNYISPVVPTRGDLQMKVGDAIGVNCKHCGHLGKKHINKITAVSDNRIILGALVLGIIVTIALLFSFGLIAVIALTLPILAWIYENNSTNSFNKYAIRRK